MLSLAQDIQTDVAALVRTFSADKDRLKSTLENMDYINKTATISSLAAQANSSGANSSNSVAVIASLRQSMNQVMQQNTLLRSKLQEIHSLSDMGNMPVVSIF